MLIHHNMTQHLITCRCGYRAWKPTPNYRHKCIERKPKAQAVTAPAPKECRYLGPATGERAESKACRTSTRTVPIYECDIYEQCTPLSNTAKLQSCLTCKDREYAGD